MIVAQQKKKENIIEYILYMWQVEDLIRANQLDMSLIDKHIMPGYQQSDDVILEIRDWWANLAEMMRMENKSEKGHLQVNINTVNDVNRLHNQLLKAPNEVAYQHLYNSMAATIQEFDNKSGNNLSNDIEICLTAIYSSFLLKLKHQKVSEQTELAIKNFSKLLSMLAKKFNEEQAGKLEL
ncbi:DUF4924 family protein [Carboxylicivirga mesophila]|uniref:DUF4924 family protein n=1 Tax=Carboxylicivirga mesophila TaxID=1166478 RepID=A0ABS5K6I3_9BACT|nr:DUF4924 family protein [Carboxylicivirga mesophila]MBS2210566.1 DUF4924 family protein [Carboxylicivirga mesophila]